MKSPIAANPDQIEPHRTAPTTIWLRRNSPPFFVGVLLASSLFLVKGRVAPREVVVPPAATFVKLDRGTQGTWKPVYGAAGFHLASRAEELPRYARISVPHELAIWGPGTTDVRALQNPVAEDRILATWYAWDNTTFDVNLTDGKTHQFAMYFLDWDSNAREEHVEVLDGRGFKVLDQRNVTGFHDGQYLVWNVAGHVKVRIKHLAGANAVVSGVFLD